MGETPVLIPVAQPETLVTGFSAHLHGHSGRHASQCLSAHFCCSFAQSCHTLRNPVDYSMPVFPVLHHLLKLAQTQWGSGISVCRWSVCDLQNEDSNPDLLSNFSIFSTFSRNLLSRKISSSPVKWGLGSHQIWGCESFFVLKQVSWYGLPEDPPIARLSLRGLSWLLFQGAA